MKYTKRYYFINFEGPIKAGHGIWQTLLIKSLLESPIKNESH